MGRVPPRRAEQNGEASSAHQAPRRSDRITKRSAVSSSTGASVCKKPRVSSDEKSARDKKRTPLVKKQTRKPSQVKKVTPLNKNKTKKPKPTPLGKNKTKKATPLAKKQTKKATRAKKVAKKKKARKRKVAEAIIPGPQLNGDCLKKVFRFLPLHDVLRLQRVCKLWRDVGQKFSELDIVDFFPPCDQSPSGRMVLRDKFLKALKDSQHTLKRISIGGLGYCDDDDFIIKCLTDVPCHSVVHAEGPLHGGYNETCPHPEYRKDPNHPCNMLCRLPRVDSLHLTDNLKFVDDEEVRWMASNILPGLKYLETNVTVGHDLPSETSTPQAWAQFFSSLSTTLRHLGMACVPGHLLHLLMSLRQKPLPQLTSLTLHRLIPNKWDDEVVNLKHDDNIPLKPQQQSVVEAVFCEHEMPDWARCPEFTARTAKSQTRVLHALCLVMAPQLTHLQVNSKDVRGDQLRSLSLLHNLRSLKLQFTCFERNRGSFTWANLGNILAGLKRHLQTFDIQETEDMEIGGEQQDLGRVLSKLEDLQDLRIPQTFLFPELIHHLPGSLHSLCIREKLNRYRPHSIREEEISSVVSLVERSPKLSHLDMAYGLRLEPEARPLLERLDRAVESSRPGQPGGPPVVPLPPALQWLPWNAPVPLNPPGAEPLEPWIPRIPLRVVLEDETERGKRAIQNKKKFLDYYKSSHNIIIGLKIPA